MGTTRENFTINLRRRRKEMRLTQANFAEKLDKAVRTYQSYEDCSVTPPPDTLDQIAHILGCQVLDLYADPDANPADNAKLSDLATAEGIERLSQQIADIKKEISSKVEIPNIPGLPPMLRLCKYSTIKSTTYIGLKFVISFKIVTEFSLIGLGGFNCAHGRANFIRFNHV